MARPPEDDPWLVDFLDEGETRENASPEDEDASETEWFPAEPRAALRSRRPTLKLDARSPVQRLALAVVGVLALTVVIAFATRGGSQASADSSYFTRLAVPAQDSQSVGSALAKLLGSAPASTKQFDSSLSTLVSRQKQDTSETLAIAAPPELRAEQQQAVSAMQFRSEGLSGLLSGFRAAFAHPSEANWGAQLAVQAESLLTSDVIWHDLFLSPTRKELKAVDVSGVAPPRSVFVATVDVLGASAMRQVLQGAAVAASSSTSSSVTGANSALQLGDSGSAVTAWQTELNKWIARQTGIPALTVSGTFDAATQSATMDLQTQAQITVDGVVGPETRSALASALAPKS